MESEDPLSQLADIHLPEAVGIWPLAPGWWILIILLIVAFTCLVLNAAKKWLLRNRLRIAIEQLDQALNNYKTETLTLQDVDDATKNKAGLTYLYAVNSVLTRVALHMNKSGSESVARLSGKAWLDYLDQSYGGIDFSSGAGKVLAEGQYRPIFEGEIDALYLVSKQWISAQYKADKPNESPSNHAHTNVNKQRPVHD